MTSSTAGPDPARQPTAEHLPERARPVAALLAAAGVPGPVRLLPEAAHTAALAAAALGCPVGAIANSLVFWCADAPLLVMTSGAHRVDTDALAARTGRPPLRRATAEQVRAATGQAIGGVAPVGHPAPLPTLVDEALLTHPTVWTAAGHPRTVVPMTVADLLRITGGTLVRVDG